MFPDTVQDDYFSCLYKFEKQTDMMPKWNWISVTWLRMYLKHWLLVMLMAYYPVVQSNYDWLVYNLCSIHVCGWSPLKRPRSYQVKMQYVQILNIIDTSIKHATYALWSIHSHGKRLYEHMFDMVYITISYGRALIVC